MNNNFIIQLETIINYITEHKYTLYKGSKELHDLEYLITNILDNSNERLVLLPILKDYGWNGISFDFNTVNNCNVVSINEDTSDRNYIDSITLLREL